MADRSSGSSDSGRMAGSVPALRIRKVNQQASNPGGDYVLYWMIAHRRCGWNFSLQRACDLALELERPLLILEALRCGYRWASDRLHGFVLDGMADNARRLTGSAAGYYPYLEPEEGAGSGLLEALAERAAVVVTDEFPCFFLPRMVAAAGLELPVALEAVDSNGLLPLAAADRTFTRAFSFRGFLQKVLPQHLGDLPQADPVAEAEEVGLRPFEDWPAEILDRWPQAAREVLDGGQARREALARLPIDHEVPPVADTPGGAEAAGRVLEQFLGRKLRGYGEDRNHPDEDGTSGLSPYLHFGHLGVHQVFTELMEQEGWTPARLGTESRGSREGWWGVSPAAESFLDELITWRELGYNGCWREPRTYDRYDSLPAWALETLAEHAGDPREHVYDLEDFEAARTHDPLWNAAQCQLRREGRIHGYLRMLWGKKVLHWTASPQEALEILVHLNNKYALDGRNPNSYSGIFWCFGRYDRAWGPEREIFGKVRYMTSDSAQRKLRLTSYLRRYRP